MGAFLSAAVNAFDSGIFLLCILTTILLQILSNLANDYGDSLHGADRAERVGPKRAVQSGHISASSMRKAILLFIILSLASGLALLGVAFGNDWYHISIFLLLGILSILAAIGYTMGRRPYGYAGLGDLSVLLFFGMTGVLGSTYLFTRDLDGYYILPAITCGLFAVAVLNVNNIRDIESDKMAGKLSVPVRIGRQNAELYHGALLTTGFLSAAIFTIIRFQSPWQFLFLLTAPLFVRHWMAIRSKPSAALDPHLRQMAIATLLFVLTFGIGLMLSR